MLSAFIDSSHRYERAKITWARLSCWKWELMIVKSCLNPSFIALWTCNIVLVSLYCIADEMYLYSTINLMFLYALWLGSALAFSEYMQQYLFSRLFLTVGVWYMLVDTVWRYNMIIMWLNGLAIYCLVSDNMSRQDRNVLLANLR